MIPRSRQTHLTGNTFPSPHTVNLREGQPRIASSWLNKPSSSATGSSYLVDSGANYFVFFPSTTNRLNRIGTKDASMIGAKEAVGDPPVSRKVNFLFLGGKILTNVSVVLLHGRRRSVWTAESRQLGSVRNSCATQEDTSSSIPHPRSRRARCQSQSALPGSEMNRQSQAGCGLSTQLCA